MELSLTPRAPKPSLPSAAMHKAALDRALDAARDPAGLLDPEPWHYYELDEETISAVAWLYARLLEEEMGAEGARAAYGQWRAVPGWILITCARHDDAQAMERAVEDCLTSVQRASLSLWSDNIPTNWVTDLVTDHPKLYDLVGVDAEREKALGILWYGHPERSPEG